MAARSSSPMIGKSIDRKGKFVVGRLLGEGAQASVHAIVLRRAESGGSTNNEEGEEISDFVIKLAPTPVKITKRRNSPSETNYNSIHQESIIYQDRLPRLQGKLIPSMPGTRSGMPRYGENKDFRFIIIERMDAGFWHLLALLESNAIANKSRQIDLGPIAAQLFVILETIHPLGKMLVDVKPENLMLAREEEQDNNKKKIKDKTSTSSFAQRQAGRIRQLDMGIMKDWATMLGHRENETGSALVGTPLYASRNVHAGHKPSRRDDLEGNLLVVAEAVIRQYAMVRGCSAAQFEQRTDVPSYLPWSQETSDDAMGRVKKAQIDDADSEFYRRMPEPAARILRTCFAMSSNLKYCEEPDYEAFKKCLSNLTVPMMDQAKGSKTESSTPVLKAAKKASSTLSRKKETPTTKKRKAAALEAAPPSSNKRARNRRVNLEESTNHVPIRRSRRGAKR